MIKPGVTGRRYGFKRALFVCVFSAAFLFMTQLSSAKDLLEEYAVLRPDSSEFIENRSGEPFFSISPPPHWFAAVRRSEAQPDATRMLFFKDDPSESMQKGFFAPPFIKVDTFLNRRNLPVIKHAAQTVTQAAEGGAEILQEPKIIKIRNTPGAHFTVRSSDESDIIIDTYLFARGRHFISMTAFSSPGAFKMTKEKLREAAYTVMFNDGPPDKKKGEE